MLQCCNAAMLRGCNAAFCNFCTAFSNFFRWCVLQCTHARSFLFHVPLLLTAPPPFPAGCSSAGAPCGLAGMVPCCASANRCSTFLHCLGSSAGNAGTCTFLPPPVAAAILPQWQQSQTMCRCRRSSRGFKITKRNYRWQKHRRSFLYPELPTHVAPGFMLPSDNTKIFFFVKGTRGPMAVCVYESYTHTHTLVCTMVCHMSWKWK